MVHTRNMPVMVTWEMLVVKAMAETKELTSKVLTVHQYRPASDICTGLMEMLPVPEM